MSNERLRAAIHAAGLTLDGLADRIGVDEKTIERWISQDRTPHRRNRITVAQALATTPQQLWPDADTIEDPTPADGANETAAEQDLIAAVTDHEQLEIDPRTLLSQASRRVDLLGLTLSDLIDPETVAGLCEKADAGCEIRILLASPDSIHLHLRETEHDPDRSLSSPPVLRWEVERTLGHLQPLLTRASATARIHVGSPSVSIVRTDDQLLATLHLLPAIPGQAPILHLRDREPAGLFARFVVHFDTLWDSVVAEVPHRLDWYPSPEDNPDRYRPPTIQDRDLHTSQAFTPEPLPAPSAEPEPERKNSRVRRLRKPKR